MKGYVKPVLSACALSSTERIAVNCVDKTDRNDWDYIWGSNLGAPGEDNDCKSGIWHYENGAS